MAELADAADSKSAGALLCVGSTPSSGTILLAFAIAGPSSRGLCRRRGPSYNSPKTATLFGVPTNTFPFAIIGVMNLFPANWSRLPDAWFEL